MEPTTGPISARKKDRIEYLAGIAVRDMDNVPTGLPLRQVPGSRYAVFECTVKTRSETYEWILRRWLPTTPYPCPGENSHKADFER